MKEDSVPGWRGETKKVALSTYLTVLEGLLPLSMDTNKITNFSIERILGTEVGPSYSTGAESSQHFACLSGTFHHGHSNPHNENWKYGMPRDLTTAHMLQVPTISHTFDSSSSYLSYGSFHCHHADINLCTTATQHRVFNDERGEIVLHLIMSLHRLYVEATKY